MARSTSSGTSAAVLSPPCPTATAASARRRRPASATCFRARFAMMRAIHPYRRSVRRRLSRRENTMMKPSCTTSRANSLSPVMRLHTSNMAPL